MKNPQDPAAMLSRRRFINLAGIVVASGVAGTYLAGCAKGGAAPAQKSDGAVKPFKGQKIRVQLWPGSDGEVLQRNVLDPFMAATGAEIIAENGHTSDSIAKLQAQKNDPQLDVVMFDDIGVVTAGREGLLERLNLANIPNATKVTPQAILEGGFGLGFFYYTNTILYNTKVFSEPPTSWNVLWDPKYQGKVSLDSIDYTGGLKQIIAAAKLGGGSQYQIDPAWAKLKALKPNIHSYGTNAGNVAELMKAGDIALAVNIPELFKGYIEKGYPIGVAYQLKEGMFASIGCAAIVKGHRASTALCEALVNQAASAEPQLGIAKDAWYGPTNTTVELPDDIKKYVFSGKLADYIIPVDLAHLSQVRQGWIDNWNRAMT